MDTDTDTDTYGSRLRAARLAKGLSHDDAAFHARTELKRPVTSKKVSRLENGTTSEQGADAPLFVVLCELYDLDPWEVSPSIAKRAEGDVLVLASWVERTKEGRPTGKLDKAGRDQRRREAA